METSGGLTYEEAMQIVKAITAFNSGKLEFVTGYLKYAGELNLDIKREGDTIRLLVNMGGNPNDN